MVKSWSLCPIFTIAGVIAVWQNHPWKPNLTAPKEVWCTSVMFRRTTAWKLGLVGYTNETSWGRQTKTNSRKYFSLLGSRVVHTNGIARVSFY
jgi:hypothetical protein